jgi:hypothetical protein
MNGNPVTEENKPPECPEWCEDQHPDREFMIHDSRAICPGDERTSVVMYAQQTDSWGSRSPAQVMVSAREGGQRESGSPTRARLELSSDNARALSVIINDAAKSGIKSVRALGKGLGELAELTREPEAKEPEAEAG